MYFKSTAQRCYALCILFYYTLQKYSGTETTCVQMDDLCAGKNKSREQEK